MSKLNSRERFLATVERKQVDRPCSWLGIPDIGAHQRLFKYFDVAGIDELIMKLDDDVVAVEMPYHSSTANAIYMAFNFAKAGAQDNEHRTLTSPGYFEDVADPAKVEEFNWPDPAKHIDSGACLQVVNNVPDNKAILGVIWSAHFQDACAAFGMENALVAMHGSPMMFRAVIDRITNFYLQANDRFYQATWGKLDAVLIGNDFGSQQGLMVSPSQLREFVFPGTKRLVDQAHSYGLKVFHHSCGAIREIIPDLIELGVDVIHPIQALANGMGPCGLQHDFGHRVSFCGGVDAQDLLVNGTVEQVRDKVLELKSIFPTGLIISPSHEAILPDTPPQNIKAMFDAIKIT